MPEPALIDSSCKAFGHPTECTEPAPGTVVSETTTGITVTVGGTTKEVAFISSAEMDFPSHAHDTDSDGNCIDFASHSIDPETGEPSITFNGSPIYVKKDSVTTDPITGGDVDIISNPITTDITI